MNTYVYGNDNPLRFVDPSGQSGIETLYLPNDSGPVVHGRTFAALALYIHGAITDDYNETNTAADILRELKPANAEVFAMVLGTRGRASGGMCPAGRTTDRATTDLVATRNGLVNVRATIERIKAGESFPYRNDGSIFQNRERLLPPKPEGYYREFVHPTPGVKGPGAQRVIQGKGGELYYTPDHYKTFVPLN